jgi:hypothetical protein
MLPRRFVLLNVVLIAWKIVAETGVQQPLVKVNGP